MRYGSCCGGGEQHLRLSPVERSSRSTTFGEIAKSARASPSVDPVEPVHGLRASRGPPATSENCPSSVPSSS